MLASGAVDLADRRWTGAVVLFEVDDALSIDCEQAECSLYNCSLALGVSWGAERATHRVLRNERARQVHEVRHVAERLYIDAHGWHTGGFDCSLNMSHGQVALRSNGNEQDGVDPFLLEHLAPLGADRLLQSALSGSSDETV